MDGPERNPYRPTDQDWGFALLFACPRSDRALAGWGPVDTVSYLTRLAEIAEEQAGQ